MNGAYKRSYGAESVFQPGMRRRLNLVAICANMFVPWFCFCTIYFLMSFTVHYLRPAVARASVFVGLAVAVIVGFMAFRAKARDSDPMWYTFASLAIFLASILGGVFGDLNFRYNMQPFYEFDSLNTYPSVNPATERGQQLMDSGRAYFVDGTGLDIKKSIGFKNDDLYCVAPITYSNHQLSSYDFWAVGVNCCNGFGGDFRCGEFNNPHARAGLRLMREDQRASFRLAVQMAEAAYNIRATHPLFFYWVQDPVAEQNIARDDGSKYFLLGILSYFVFNAICVVCTSVGFSRIGYGYY